jgi:hypothetical protein
VCALATTVNTVCLEAAPSKLVLRERERESERERERERASPVTLHQYLSSPI